MKKKIKLLQVGDKWWWINKTDNELPAGGKEFDSAALAIKDINTRVKDYELLEEYVPKRPDRYEDNEEEVY
jgi:hypothetical protein